MNKEKAARKNRLGDLFRVLNGSVEKGLPVHVANAMYAGKAQAMAFFGLCEGVFHGLPATGINPLTVMYLRKFRFQIILPNMARRRPSC